ncbi:SH3 domain-containing protein C23A1.17-like [Schistocerca piceifrons]|uniref:SH3 domain-containing protein C23A1.17-like n=1 Tax=Schistocerca piceifrons TaxID=274613 RepID=UPI001F5E975F|nr:SH3 domain-containing protein C23A1.17-like [Schistocerca piceifrons]
MAVWAHSYDGTPAWTPATVTAAHAQRVTTVQTHRGLERRHHNQLRPQAPVLIPPPPPSLLPGADTSLEVEPFPSTSISLPALQTPLPPLQGIETATDPLPSGDTLIDATDSLPSPPPVVPPDVSQPVPSFRPPRHRPGHFRPYAPISGGERSSTFRRGSRTRGRTNGRGQPIEGSASAAAIPRSGSRAARAPPPTPRADSGQ